MYTGKAAVIFSKLQELSEKDYRSGFNDSVLSECRDVLEDFEDGAGRVFWNKMLTYGRQEIFKEYFGGSQSLMDYYDVVDANSRKEGCFVMPSWGTYGT